MHGSGPASAAVALALAGPVAPGWAAGTTELISVGMGGVPANGGSGSPSISANGRFVAFTSSASNLVPGDTNRSIDVFVHDRLTRRTQRVNVRTGGAQGNSESSRFGSYAPAISSDGRFVVFHTRIADLVPGDTNRTQDVFVHDLRSRRTERVSVATGGAEGNNDSGYAHISADGRFVAFTGPGNLAPGDPGSVFVRDRWAGTTERVIGGSFGGSLSADGRFVSFDSDATNLVPGDTNGVTDVFVRDRRTGQAVRVSVRTGGGQSNGNIAGSGSYSRALSADGRIVAMAADAIDLVPGDTNGETDAFVHDRSTGVTRRMNVGPGGVQANGRINDGMMSYDVALSPGGRFVAFVSDATNLVPGGSRDPWWDVFLRDRQTGRNEQISVSTDGGQADGESYSPMSISAGGRFVAFSSAANNLAPGDANPSGDVFVRVR